MDGSSGHAEHSHDRYHARALVVEDDDSIRLLLSRILEEMGYQTRACADAESAESYLDSQPPFALLLLDWMLPGHGGDYLCHAVRRRSQYDASVIMVITGSTDPQILTEALNAGADDYLQKPFDPALLQVRLAVAGRRCQEKRERADQTLRMQRDLAMALYLSGDLTDGLQRVLDACTQLTRIDCGGVYLFGGLSGSADFDRAGMELVAHAGISRSFARAVSRFDSDDALSRLVQTGRVWFGESEQLLARSMLQLLDRKLMHVAVVPVSVDGRVRGAMVLGSFDPEPFGGTERDTIEAIGRQVDLLLRRVAAEQALRDYRDQLEQRVVERTRALSIANEQLQKEIAERQQAEAREREQQQQMIEAEKLIALGTLVSGVAHEINNPNHFISLNAQNLAEVWTPIAEVLNDQFAAEPNRPIGQMTWQRCRRMVPEMLAGICEGTRRINVIVSELKHYARGDSAGPMAVVDLNAVVRSSLVLVGNPVRKATQHFLARLSDRPVYVRGNAGRLEQVVINLIMNACEALTDRSQSIEVITEVDRQGCGGWVVVKDQGRGIAPAMLEQIKDPFFTTKRAQGGTGLGLAVSSRIVDEHQGQLQFVSSPDQGTEARLWLPLADDDELQDH